MGVPSIGIDLGTDILDIPEAASRFGRRYHIHGQNFPKNMIDLLSWSAGLEVVHQILETYEMTEDSERPMTQSHSNVKIEAPIERPGKIIGLGLNYREHIEETGRDVPDFPVIFAKFPSSIVRPNAEIPIPPLTKKLDWEVELGIVIGRTCRNVTSKDALDYVAGYTIINDLSARDLQKSGEGQWVEGKSLDGLCPVGPCIVTTDELGDGSGLKIQTMVNETVKQESNTSNLIFGVKEIVSYLSKRFTLEPGDLVASGTPSGVGFARSPPEFLKSGDVVKLNIERIGTLVTKIL